MVWFPFKNNKSIILVAVYAFLTPFKLQYYYHRLETEPDSRAAVVQCRYICLRLYILYTVRARAGDILLYAVLGERLSQSE